MAPCGPTSSIAGVLVGLAIFALGARFDLGLWRRGVDELPSALMAHPYTGQQVAAFWNVGYVAALANCAARALPAVIVGVGVGALELVQPQAHQFLLVVAAPIGLVIAWSLGRTVAPLRLGAGNALPDEAWPPASVTFLAGLLMVLGAAPVGYFAARLILGC